MKSFVYLFVTLLISVSFALGDSLEFDLLGTDYTGIFYSGNTIMLYGKYGIITYSNDLGVNWGQSYLGQKNNVLKVISVDDKFYALSPEKIFVSKDQGKSWQETPIHWEQSFVDFCTDGSQIYIITENEILSMDKELKSDLSLLFQFDPFIKFTEMAIWNEYLFMIDAKISIVKFNILTNTPEDTIFTGFPQRQIEKLKIRNSTMYVLLVSNERSPSFEYNYQFIRHTVLYSNNLGKTWKIFAEGIPITRDYLVEGNDVYTLSPKLFRNNQNFTVSYVKANSQGLIEENDVAEPNTWIPYLRLIEEANTFQINAIERINDSMLIACGNSKTILISKDNGRRWTFASYFRPIYSLFFNRDINQIIQRGRDTIVVLAYYRPYMFASFDGGATFRTLGIDTNFRKLLSVYSCPLTLPNGQLGYFIFQRDSNGHPTGTIMTVKLNFLDNEYKVDTFSLKSNEFIKWDSIEVIFIHDPLYFKGKIFVTASLQQSRFSSSATIVLDNNLKLIDTLFLPRVVSLPVSDGDYLYSLSSDSEKTYVLKTSSLKSDWEVVVSIPQISYKKPNEEAWLDLEKVIDNYFIFTKKNSQYVYHLLFFDKSNGHLDSIEVPSSPRVFSLGDTIFVLTNKWLREFPNLPQDTSSFVEYSLSDIGGWKISSVFRLENQDYISLEKMYESTYDNVWDGNFGKLKRKVSAPDIVVEEVKPFLFCFPLYPNPALSYVNLAVCWDKEFSIDNINFSFFNLNGQKLEVPYSLLAQSEPNCGVVRFFVNDFSPGIYFINVKLQNSEWTVPFILTK